jgi:2'-5' RNA ligase
MMDSENSGDAIAPDAGAEKLPLYSVQILLPETSNRRLARWSERMPGASWPSWGGHVTLVPHFWPRVEEGALLALLEETCREETPIPLRFDEAIAVPDVTRSGYFAVFLTVVVAQPMTEADPAPSDELPDRLAELRARLLDALEGLRDEARPQLSEQPFLPHVTLAIGLHESEAMKVVRELRNDPLTGEFTAEVVWLMRHEPGDANHVERHPIPLGTVTLAQLRQD